MKILNGWICQIINYKIEPIYGDLEIEDGTIVGITPKQAQQTLQYTHKNIYKQ